MGARSSTGSPTRWFAGLVAIGALWWVAFEQHDRIPGLTYVNLGLHEFGHMVTYSASGLTDAMAGSIAQVAIPLLIALWLFIRRGDWVAAGVCLAWAATSALEVAEYVADAPTQKLDLIGDQHDWAYILGPNGYDALDKSASLANTIHHGASVAVILGFVLCLTAPLKGAARGRRQPEETAFTRREMPDSSPWAASATSGSAPRSASSPK